MAEATQQGSLGGSSSRAGSDELRVFEGMRPTRTGDLVLEGQGMAPIPAGHRYGGVYRMFTVWFTPNMGLPGVFAGTLAVVFGLGFGLGLVAIVAGTIVGSLPVAILCTWGPRTGTAQVPLARLPFGKTIVLPGAVQWLSSIAWDALVGLFGGQAAQLLFHVPFWLGVAIVLALEGVISVFGYEFVHRVQEWGSAILIVLFIVLTVKIFQHHVVLPVNTVHGGALVGAFVLMVTISLSEGISWASYASDYSRYMKPTSSKAGIFWLTLAGLTASYVWVETIGLAGASVLSTHTAAGVRTLMGGGFLGVLALIAIVFSAVASNSMNDYTGSLAFQALGARVRRPIVAAVVAILAFAPILYMNAGNTSGKFQNVLLFTAYWIAPFCAIVMIDWHYNKERYTPSFLRGALGFRKLGNGWPAFVAFAVAFGVMVPFMNTSIIVGPFANALKGADIAFYVGFVVAGVLYYVLRNVAITQEARRAPALASADSRGEQAGKAGAAVTDMDERELADEILRHIDTDRAVQLSQEVCRIPSVLGEEGPLAEFLADVMKESGFEAVELQPVLPDRPNATGEVSFGTGPRVVLTGHMDTKPVSHGWAAARPFSGALIGDAVYGHGIMDMKAALACEIVAIEALASSGLPLSGTVAMSAVSDHMGDQAGAIAYFGAHPGSSADMCVLGELTGNEVCLGHRGRYQFDVTVFGRSAHSCHKHLAVNANALAARVVLALDASRYEPDMPDDVRELFGPETYVVPGRICGGLPPGGPSMIPDECVIRVDCRPQPGVTVAQVRAEIDRCLAEARGGDSRVAAQVELADVKPGYLARPDDEVVRLMRRAVGLVRGGEPRLVTENWLGDTASFGAKVPTVIFGPGGPPVYCPDEHLAVADIHEAARAYAVFAALALAGNP